MHELGICEGVLEAVLHRATGRRVAAIGVRASAALRIVPEAFAMSFEMVAAGSVADGATVELVTVPIRGRCRDCGAAVESVDVVPACATCGGLDLAREASEDLVLEWVRYREPVTGLHEAQSG